LFSLLALAVGFTRFWREMGATKPTWPQVRQALHDAATLRYLGGGGHGCNDVGEGFSTARRLLHHFMAYGFLLCFAATSVGAIYDRLLGWVAPYRFFSLPVVLGTVGGAGLVVGCSGLLWLKLSGDQEPRARRLLGADAGLLLLLLLIGVTGLLLLGVRGTGAMGTALAVHLGLVLALFVTLPYGKFVHAAYRTGALIRYAMEHPPG
jgi:citrate/tricarballylate utilization protein